MAYGQYHLRFLHISDLHWKGAREKEPWRRRRVLGDAWQRNLETLLGEEGTIDFVFFTGDAAQSGKPDEFDGVTDFLHSLCRELGIGQDRLFVVPGNHDVDRDVQKGVWESMRMRLAASSDLLGVSRWMNGISGQPLGFEDSWRTEILERQDAYRKWVKDELKRPQLAPGGLGYRESVALPGWALPIHIIGLDTAWLCGDEADATRLVLTENQAGRRCSPRFEDRAHASPLA
jgi:predicted MPP superfamily phosphohydrolase